jgi:hypothetical protein
MHDDADTSNCSGRLIGKAFRPVLSGGGQAGAKNNEFRSAKRRMPHAMQHAAFVADKGRY